MKTNLPSLLTTALRLLGGAALVLLWLPLSSCDSRRNEPDLEKEQWIYLYLTRPVNLLAICTEAQRPAFACAIESGLPGGSENYVVAMESIYSVTVLSPRDEASLCSQLVETTSFPDPTSPGTTYTVGARTCFFQCGAAYWQRKRDEGSCTSALYPTLSPLNDTDYQGCLNRCFQEGSILPP